MMYRYDEVCTIQLVMLVGCDTEKLGSRIDSAFCPTKTSGDCAWGLFWCGKKVLYQDLSKRNRGKHYYKDRT